MVNILHLSDLHIISGAVWNNMRGALLEHVHKKLEGKIDQEKMLVITGDFHNYRDYDYEIAKKFLRELIQTMEIDPAQDVFVIPGNHDVSNETVMQRTFETDRDWKKRKEAAIAAIKDKDGKIREYMEWRMESFGAYNDFVKELGIYEKNAGNIPASVHIRNWRGKLNILHLNTALAADGTSKNHQKIDMDTATDDQLWKEADKNCPTIAIGHNSYYDLDEEHKIQLAAIFGRKNVRAYLCGDVHKLEENRECQMIRLRSGYGKAPEIPNIVCPKGAPDSQDEYSEFGFYWHEWDEETGDVHLISEIWKRDVDQNKFEEQKNERCYFMNDLPEEQIQVNVCRQTAEVQEKYFQFLKNELGMLQFDGIPTDKDAGSVKVDLENVFVPLDFMYIGRGEDDEDDDKDDVALELKAISDVLTDSRYCAILAKPGGGKSTLIRRIALAYAYPERKKKVEDGLPDRDWFPIYIRCRDLGEDVVKSISDIIFSVANRAEFPDQKEDFTALVRKKLRENKLFLLIDGLDEIANEKNRIAFAEHLATFIQAYPNVHLLLTSRETGFRVVAGKMGQYCCQYKIAELDDEKIRALSDNWHVALIDNETQAKIDSENVCNIILQDARITELARNPLLLTTLLFVKRWIGYLPTKKCQLYQEMIKLLLVSWNASAHDKMEIEETEPQLAYIAYYMTQNGKQTISRPELLKCIGDIRNAMPDLLGYVRVSPAEFLKQVEERSSLLIQQGYEEDERGDLVSSYEFSHLSFQEYLTAKAITERWILQDDQITLETVIQEKRAESQWWESIPLAMVMLKRQAKRAMECLIQICENELEPPQSKTHRENKIAAFHLANCVANEVPMDPQLLDRALLLIAKQCYAIYRVDYRSSARHSHTKLDVFRTIYKSKYGSRMQEVVQEELFGEKETEYVASISNVWVTLHREEHGEQDLTDIEAMIAKGDRIKRVTGELLMMRGLFEERWGENAPKSVLEKIYTKLVEIMKRDDLIERSAAVWCIAWSRQDNRLIIPSSCCQDVVNQLIALWCMKVENWELRRFISWAVLTLCDTKTKIAKDDILLQAISDYMENPQNENDKGAALCVKVVIGDMDVQELRTMKNRPRALNFHPLVKGEQ